MARNKVAATMAAVALGALAFTGIGVTSASAESYGNCVKRSVGDTHVQAHNGHYDTFTFVREYERQVLGDWQYYQIFWNDTHDETWQTRCA